MAGQAGLQPAVVAAVLLAPVVPRTNVEARRAPRAAQVVEGNARVHPRSRVDRNWTGASGSSKLQAYGPSAACTVRVRVAARALTSLPPTVGVTPGPRSGRVSGPPLPGGPRGRRRVHPRPRSGLGRRPALLNAHGQYAWWGKSPMCSVQSVTDVTGCTGQPGRVHWNRGRHQRGNKRRRQEGEGWGREIERKRRGADRV